MKIFACLVILSLFSGCMRETKRSIFTQSLNDDLYDSHLTRSPSQNKEQKMYNKTQTIIIAGGKPNSTKYNVAGVICKFINHAKDSNIRCLVDPNSSVNYALNNSSKYDFIISQTNLDQKIIKSNLKSKLYSVLSLYPETFTLIVSEKSGIKSIKDLPGKKVYAGGIKSAARIAFKDVLASEQLSDSSIEYVRSLDVNSALCDSKIDVIFNGISHPNTEVQELLNCGAKIIPLSGNYFDSLIKEHNEYIDTNIFPGIYQGYAKGVDSFGVMVNLLATSKTNPKIVEDVVKMIFENMQQFKIYHRALLTIPSDEMTFMNDGLIFPFHKSALQYYNKQGIKLSKR